ncbi:MAG: SIS domain-containing protein [Chloroflexi bacterium]|nr:SIS domain-containing protein [Chloroflexota bacterium]MCI0579366.1 SIS domain-containing protein [Chloroflexota bacterium]MCI0646214.1 SIS domain-containing protein [Chloroflexota bacterium]MCI0726919.1 SIS domain-containing protein [Chloroflexota bacterium]
MSLTPLHQEVNALPALVPALVASLADVLARLPSSLCEDTRRVFLAGCGDSHHAALAAELAFEQLAGLPCEPMTALQFSRYAVGYLPGSNPRPNLVVGISASGQVSRTIEALELARRAGATTVAVTADPQSPLALAAEYVAPATLPPLPAALASLVIPGVRSTIASQLALYLLAIRLGTERGHLATVTAGQLRQELAGTASLMAETIAASDPAAAHLAQAWLDAGHFVTCGAGPNYGTALYSAAKLVEASGDPAIGQDLEEWAHLQYFGREVATPTFLISAGGWDTDRALEIATAAKRIGRRVAVIAPANSPLAQTPDKDALLPTAGPLRECFSPLVTALPAVLFAAHRAGQMGEPYFRNFGGGRQAEGGGGISRIRTSRRLAQVRK